MYKDGVKIKRKSPKPLKRYSRVFTQGSYDTNMEWVKGKCVKMKTYLQTMLSSQQGEAFDLDAFNETFESDDWQTLCDEIPTMERVKGGIRMKIEPKKPEDMKPRIFYLTKESRRRVKGELMGMKEYLQTMLSSQQGEAFDLDAFNKTFESDDWKTLADEIPILQKLI